MVIILDKDLKKEIDADLKEKSKMTPELFIKIKQRIEEYEVNQNRLKFISSFSVEARNIRIRDKKVVADIYFTLKDVTEKWLDAEYNLIKLLENK